MSASVTGLPRELAIQNHLHPVACSDRLSTQSEIQGDKRRKKKKHENRNTSETREKNDARTANWEASNEKEGNTSSTSRQKEGTQRHSTKSEDNGNRDRYQYLPIKREEKYARQKGNIGTARQMWKMRIYWKQGEISTPVHVHW